MGLYLPLVVLALIIAVLLIIVVLLQAGKGDGLAGSIAGGASMGQVFGTRRLADGLGTITWILASALLILALIISLFANPSTSANSGNSKSINQTEQSN